MWQAYCSSRNPAGPVLLQQRSEEGQILDMSILWTFVSFFWRLVKCGGPIVSTKGTQKDASSTQLNNGEDNGNKC